MNICFFGASSSCLDSVSTDTAYELGQLMAKSGHTLVYGAGCEGLMGAIARGMSDNSGRIIGISPEFFKGHGVLYDRCTEMYFTNDMRQRKGMMERMSEAVIMMPGSIGTYEEFFEILTLKQLGRINKPIVALNVNGYFDPLEAMLRHAVDERFLKPESMSIYKTVDTPAEALEYIETYSDDPGVTAWYKDK